METETSEPAASNQEFQNIEIPFAPEPAGGRTMEIPGPAADEQQEPDVGEAGEIGSVDHRDTVAALYGGSSQEWSPSAVGIDNVAFLDGDGKFYFPTDPEKQFPLEATAGTFEEITMGGKQLVMVYEAAGPGAIHAYTYSRILETGENEQPGKIEDSSEPEIKEPAGEEVQSLFTFIDLDGQLPETDLGSSFADLFFRNETKPESEDAEIEEPEELFLDSYADLLEARNIEAAVLPLMRPLRDSKSATDEKPGQIEQIFRNAEAPAEPPARNAAAPQRTVPFAASILEAAAGTAAAIAESQKQNPEAGITFGRTHENKPVEPVTAAIEDKEEQNDATQKFAPADGRLEVFEKNYFEMPEEYDSAEWQPEETVSIGRKEPADAQAHVKNMSRPAAEKNGIIARLRQAISKKELWPVERGGKAAAAKEPQTAPGGETNPVQEKPRAQAGNPEAPLTVLFKAPLRQNRPETAKPQREKIAVTVSFPRREAARAAEAKTGKLTETITQNASLIKPKIQNRAHAPAARPAALYSYIESVRQQSGPPSPKQEPSPLPPSPQSADKSAKQAAVKTAPLRFIGSPGRAESAMHEPDVRPAMPITPLKAAQNPPTKIAAQSPLGHMRTNETKNSKRDADVRPPRTPVPAGKTPSPAGRTTRPQPAARQSGAVQPPAAPQQPIPFRPPRGDRHPVKEPESPHSGNAKQPLAEPKIAHTLPNNNETLQRINTASQRPARTGRPEPGNAPAGPAARTVPERPVKISAPDRQPQFPTENKPHVNSLFSESKMSRPLSRDASASPQAGRTNQSARTAEAAAAGGRPRNTYIDSGPAEDAVEGAAASSGMPHYKAA